MPSNKPNQMRRGNGPQKTTGGDDGLIDASPGSDAGTEVTSSSGQKGKKPRNVQETKLWKDVISNMKAMWGTYASILVKDFQSTPRQGQEDLITKTSVIFSVGSAVLAVWLFYAFLPTVVRVFFLPAALVVAWWGGTKIVAPQMIIRFSKYLNRD